MTVVKRNMMWSCQIRAPPTVSVNYGSFCWAQLVMEGVAWSRNGVALFHRKTVDV